jgi:hypothetical protein
MTRGRRERQKNGANGGRNDDETSRNDDKINRKGARNPVAQQVLRKSCQKKPAP